MNEWRIYQGVGEPHDGIERLPAPHRGGTSGTAATT